VKLSAKHLFCAIVALAALVLFYVKTNRIVSAEHERFDRSLRRLHQLDATMNQDVLKARFRLLNDYDGFPDAINELKRTAGSLAAIPSFIPDAGRKSMGQKVDELSLLLGQKEQLLESFKSQNAVLNNSLDNFPEAANGLINRLPSNDGGRELKSYLYVLTRYVLAYSLNSRDKRLAPIRRTLEKVDDWSLQHPGHPEAAALAGLVAHANSIVSLQPRLKALTQELLSVPIDERAEELLRLYEAHFAQALHTANLYRIALYVFCALLVLGIGFTLYSLNAANVNLERCGRSVLDHTVELTEKNAQLQAEIIERQRTQKQLAESEHRQRLILESQPECVKKVAADGTLLYMNPAGLKVIEADHLDQVAGRSVYGLVAPEYRAMFRALNEAVFQGESRIAEFEIIGLKGTRRWMETHACPLRDTEGRFSAQLAVTRDVSERKSKEEELRRTQVFLNSVVENLPIGVFIKEAKELRFVLWSKGNEELIGLSRSEVIGKNDHDFFSKEEADAFTAKDRETLEHGHLVNVAEEIIQTRHHGQRTLLTRKVPILDENGRPAYLLGISEDITNRKLAEAELEQTHRQLLDTSRQAGMAEVATGVLHNVGNVLNSVNVSATLLSEQAKKSKVSDLADVVALMEQHSADLAVFITQDPRGRQLPGFLAQLSSHLAVEQTTFLKETEQLRKNVEHVKDIVAMQQSYAKVSGVTETLNISDLVEDALRMNASALTRHEVEVVRDYAEIPPVTTDKHKVLQVLVNLIRNAKYACDESGRVDKRMTVRVANGDGQVRIAIIDNGVGIPPENLIRIFNHGFTTRKEGHGFGLHSGALAAKEMGGSLSVQSDGPGQGAVFTLELPCLQTEPNDELQLCQLN